MEVNCFEFEEIDKLNLMDLPIKWINGKIKTKDKIEINNVPTLMSHLFVEVFVKLP